MAWCDIASAHVVVFTANSGHVLNTHSVAWARRCEFLGGAAAKNILEIDA